MLLDTILSLLLLFEIFQIGNAPYPPPFADRPPWCLRNLYVFEEKMVFRQISGESSLSNFIFHISSSKHGKTFPCVFIPLHQTIQTGWPINERPPQLHPLINEGKHFKIHPLGTSRLLQATLLAIVSFIFPFSCPERLLFLCCLCLTIRWWWFFC